MSQRLPDLALIRQSKGLTLDEIAKTTKIPVHHLRAIEDGKISTLPGGVYTANYLRQYARAIDYDDGELLGRYAVLPGSDLNQPQGADEGWKVIVDAWAKARQDLDRGH